MKAHSALGAVYASLGVGGLLAVILPGSSVSGGGAQPSCTSAGTAAGIFATVAGLAPRLFVVALMASGVRFGIGLGHVIWFTLVQEHVPKRVLGRVFSVDMLVSTGLFPLSIALSGPVVAAIGAPATLVAGGPPRRRPPSWHWCGEGALTLIPRGPAREP